MICGARNLEQPAGRYINEADIVRRWNASGGKCICGASMYFNKRRSSHRGRTSSVALSASSSMMTSGPPPRVSREPPRGAGRVPTPSAEPATRSSSMGLIRGALCAAQLAVCLCSPERLSCLLESCSPACEELPPGRVVCPLVQLCFCLASRPFAYRSLCERFVIDFFTKNTHADLRSHRYKLFLLAIVFCCRTTRGVLGCENPLSLSALRPPAWRPQSEGLQGVRDRPRERQSWPLRGSEGRPGHPLRL